jgi:hypothetical protein
MSLLPTSKPKIEPLNPLRKLLYIFVLNMEALQLQPASPTFGVGS